MFITNFKYLQRRGRTKSNGMLKDQIDQTNMGLNICPFLYGAFIFIFLICKVVYPFFKIDLMHTYIPKEDVMSTQEAMRWDILCWKEIQLILLKTVKLQEVIPHVFEGATLLRVHSHISIFLAMGQYPVTDDASSPSTNPLVDAFIDLDHTIKSVPMGFEPLIYPLERPCHAISLEEIHVICQTKND